MRDQKIIEYVTAAGWALHKPVLERLAQIIGRHAAGIRVGEDELEEIRAARAAQRGPGADGADMEIMGGIASLPIRGVIAKLASQVNGVSQPRGTSGETIRDWVRQAVGNPRVHTIFLDVDSPGGTVDGITEMADEIRIAAEQKRVVAFADGLMASAAYWIGSQATEIHATQTSVVGSIGVYQLIPDWSGAFEQEGIKMHIVRSGRHKGVGAPGVPVEPDQLAVIQEEIDHFHAMFVDAVSAGRGMNREAVGELADGRAFIGSNAKDVGLVDGIGTREELLAHLNENPPESAAARQGRKEPSAAAAATQERTEDMTEPDTAAVTTAADLEKTYPALVKEIREDAAKAAIGAERERITTIRGKAMMPMQAELAEKLIADGASVAEATDAILEDIKANANKWAKEVVTQQPLGNATSDPDGGPDDDRERVFDEAKGQYVTTSNDASGDDTPQSFDYSDCANEDEVEALAKKEYASLPKQKRAELKDEKTFVALRRGEFREQAENRRKAEAAAYS